MVYGMAKDFGVSGLRVGALASRNQELLDAHTNLVQKTKKFFGLSHFILETIYIVLYNVVAIIVRWCII
eukprot:COSAG06_NODE_753_length_12547_cov_928.116244_4_plen_69_part_00